MSGPSAHQTLLHKDISVSVKGAMLDSHRHREGGETSEAYLGQKRELLCVALQS